MNNVKPKVRARWLFKAHSFHELRRMGISQAVAHQVGEWDQPTGPRIGLYVKGELNPTFGRIHARSPAVRGLLG